MTKRKKEEEIREEERGRMLTDLKNFLPEYVATIIHGRAGDNEPAEQEAAEEAIAPKPDPDIPGAINWLKSHPPGARLPDSFGV